MSWSLQTYIGIGPLEFGMSFEEVRKIVGIGGRIKKSDAANFRYLAGRKKPITIFCNEKLAEISFTVDAEEKILYRDLDLLHDKERDIIAMLASYNKSEILEISGFLLFFDIGVALSGFHDGDLNQKAISAFEEKKWDLFKSKANIFDANHYK